MSPLKLFLAIEQSSMKYIFIVFQICIVQQDKIAFNLFCTLALDSLIRVQLC
jgi:hypothetical protein